MPGTKIGPPATRTMGNGRNRGGHPGRPPGIKEDAPRLTAKRKVGIRAIYEEVLQELEKGGDALKKFIKQRIVNGDPFNDSLGHIKLAGAYIDGMPVQRLQVTEVQPVFIVKPDDPRAQDEATEPKGE